MPLPSLNPNPTPNSALTPALTPTLTPTPTLTRFEALKEKRDVLGVLMAELGVRPLPPAALGGGWDAAPLPPAPLDCPMTMHGQHAGGV